MEKAIHDLGWLRFFAQAIVGVLGIIGGVFANQIFSADSFETWDYTIATNLVLIPLVALMLMSRIPYRTDEFERRLRNWSMTQSAVWVLIGGVVARILTELPNSGPSPITIFILPAAFFLVHVLYSQFLRFKIATGGRNAFSDGSC